MQTAAAGERTTWTQQAKERLRLRTRALKLLRTARVEKLGLRPLRDLFEDLRWGGWCGGKIANPFAHQGAVKIQSTHYGVLDDLFGRNRIDIRPDDVIVDVGCGKGRVLNWFLRHGHGARVVGIELVDAVADTTRRRLAEYPNVRIVKGDIVDNVPADGTLFYLYNPFSRDTTQKFAEAVLRTVSAPQKVRLVYYNARHYDVFEGDARWKARRLDVAWGNDAAAMMTIA